MIAHAAPLKHWYHEPWPWLLMAGPAVVILAGVITTYLAVVTSDGLVADDYYKRGLAINQTLSRDAVARQLGYHARVVFTPDFGRVDVSLAGGAQDSEAMVLRLAHSGRTSLDRVLPLTREGSRIYAAAFPSLTPGRWQLTLEDRARTWRLVGDTVVPGHGVIEMVPR
ncbi:MAG: FixH family protein [Burkholderiales bacterium]